MFSQAEKFRAYYLASVGTKNSAASYLTYLRKFDKLCGGLDERLETTTPENLIEWASKQPNDAFGGAKLASDIKSALRCYVDFLSPNFVAVPAQPEIVFDNSAATILDLLRQAKNLGACYYRLTGKPLGVTGEVAELEAAEKLGLALSVARTPGYDAMSNIDGVQRRIQIKGRAVDPARRYLGRCPAIKCGDQFDDVLLVLLDRATLDAIEIWQTDEASVIARLSAPGSKSRNERHSMGISQFKSIARRVWP